LLKDKFGGSDRIQPLISKDTLFKVRNNPLASFVTVEERSSVIDWYAKFCAQFSLSRATFALATCFFDRSIELQWHNNSSKKLFSGNKTARLEGTAVVCLFLAAKVEETRPPRIEDIMRCLNNTYDKGLMLELESEIL
jgi:hypothetical protein